MHMKSIFVAFLAFSVFSTDGNAQPSCKPLPEKCEAANARATKYVETLLSRLNGAGANQSASIMYCANMVGAEVAKYCASEFRSQSNDTCAKALEGDRESMIASARSAAQTAEATSATATDQWKSICEFQ